VIEGGEEALSCILGGDGHFFYVWLWLHCAQLHCSQQSILDVFSMVGNNEAHLIYAKKTAVKATQEKWGATKVSLPGEQRDRNSVQQLKGKITPTSNRNQPQL
jgi:hypothetical protein